MKSTLSHLPEKNQFEINHIVEIIKEVLNPQMIILFGSYAKGKQVNHKYQNKDGSIHEYISDYDFLIVVNKVTKETSDQEWLIEEKADIYEPPVNLEIHEIDFINRGLETGQYFFTDIIKEGIVLYNTGAVTFAESRELTAEEQKQIASEDFKHWFEKGKEFLIGAGSFAERNSYTLGAFILHQAAESLYTTILLVFTGYKPKTHNLKKLRRKAKQHSAELFLVFDIESNKDDNHLFDLLKRGYIDARYKPNYKIAETEFLQILERVNIMKDLVHQACQNKINVEL